MSVPSPPSTTIRSHARGRSSLELVGRPGGRPASAAVSRFEDRRDAACVEPSRQFGEDSRGRLQIVLGDEPDPMDRRHSCRHFPLHACSPMYAGAVRLMRLSSDAAELPLPSMPVIGDGVARFARPILAHLPQRPRLPPRARARRRRGRCPLCRLRRARLRTAASRARRRRRQARATAAAPAGSAAAK